MGARISRAVVAPVEALGIVATHSQSPLICRHVNQLELLASGSRCCPRMSFRHGRRRSGRPSRGLSSRYTNAQVTLLFKGEDFDKTDILPAVR
jgi:hypothetical protein